MKAALHPLQNKGGAFKIPKFLEAKGARHSSYGGRSRPRPRCLARRSLTASSSPVAHAGRPRNVRCDVVLDSLQSETRRPRAFGTAAPLGRARAWSRCAWQTLRGSWRNRGAAEVCCWILKA